MKRLTANDRRSIRAWMRRNARPLEWTMWEHAFEGGATEPALLALAAFQNEDGGFGHALEADNWNPNSSPFVCTSAANALNALGIFDADHPIVSRLLAYLDRTCGEDGWPFTVPSNNDFPHAPWHGFSEENNRANRYHATTQLVGFVLRAARPDMPVYRKSLALAERMWAHAMHPESMDPHEVMGMCGLVETVQRAGLGKEFDVDVLIGRLRPSIDALIERDPAKWPVYSMRPSMFIKSPESPFYAGNEDVLEKELDYVLDTRQEVWDISWQWVGYEREFAVARMWWMGLWAILNVGFLASFGRIEFEQA